MNVGETARYVVMFTSWLIVIEVVVTTYTFLKVTVPLRRRLGAAVIAPPTRWAISYFLCVAVLAALQAVTILLRMRQGASVLPTTYVTAVVNIVLIITLHRFLTYYRTARQQAREHT